MSFRIPADIYSYFREFDRRTFSSFKNCTLSAYSDDDMSDSVLRCILNSKNIRTLTSSVNISLTLSDLERSKSCQMVDFDLYAVGLTCTC